MDDGVYDADVPAEKAGASQPQQSKAKNLAGLMRNKATAPVVRLTVVSVLVVGALAAVALMARDKKADRPTADPAALSGADVGAAPATIDGQRRSDMAQSAAYQDAVRAVEAERAASAAAAGESSQPSSLTVEANLKPSMTPEEQARKEAEAARLRSLEEAAARAAKPADSTGQGQTVTYTAGPGMNEEMLRNAREAMGRLTGSRQYGADVFSFGGPSVAASAAQQAQATAIQVTSQPVQRNAAAGQPRVLIQAGTLEAAEMLTSVNTDRGSKFAVKLLTGKYAGSVLRGEYRREGDVAAGTLTAIAIPGFGASLPAAAEILDPITLESGYATEVDRKLITKYGIKPIASGLAAVADYLRMAGTTVVTNGTTTVTAQPEFSGKRAAQIVGAAGAQAIANDSSALNTTPTAKIEAKAMVGVLFTDDVRYTPASAN